MASEDSYSECNSSRCQPVSSGFTVSQLHAALLKISWYVILFSIFSPISVRWLHGGPTVSEALTLSAAATSGASMVASGSRQADAAARDQSLSYVVRAVRSTSVVSQPQRQSSSTERRKSGITASSTMSNSTTKTRTGAKRTSSQESVERTTAVVVANDVGIASGDQLSQRPYRLDISSRCVEIPSTVKLCSGIDYNHMRLPNLLGHESMAEVIDQSKSWISLRDIGCHPDTRVFLCSLFTPVCFLTTQPSPTIYPCRSFCRAVQASCEPRMKRYGYKWPEMFNCNQFPVDNDMCISQLSKEPQVISPEVIGCNICTTDYSLASIVDKYCNAEFAILVTVDQVVQGNDLKVVATTKKIYRSGSLTRKELRGQVSLHVRNGRSCDCISTLMPSSGGNVTYLAIGNRSATSDGKLVLTLLMRADQKTGEVQRAIKAIANDTDCRNGKSVIEAAGGQNPKEGTAGKSTSRTTTPKVICGKKRPRGCRRSTPTPAHQVITSSTLELNGPDVTARSERRKLGRMSTATTAAYVINPTMTPGNDGTTVTPGKERKRRSTTATVTASTTLVPTRSGTNGARRRTTEKAVTN